MNDLLVIYDLTKEKFFLLQKVNDESQTTYISNFQIIGTNIIGISTNMEDILENARPFMKGN